MRMQQKKRGRPVLDEQQKIDKEVLKQKMLEHSIEALDTIVDIMRNSMDNAIRLKASSFIINKLIPQGFTLDDVTRDHNFTINLINVPDRNDSEKYEEQSEINDEDDEWGSDVFKA